MSGDPEQEYFADGIAEDIITALSHCNALFVIARNSSFTYKGKTVDVRQVGRELGVRYVLEGSVRRSGARLRVTGQLNEAESGNHMWADHFDGDMSDVFDFQDRITECVVAAIEPNLQRAEIERLKRKPAKNLDAYDLLLRAQQLEYEFTEESLREALGCLKDALAIDPAYAPAMALAAYCQAERRVQGWMREPATEITEGQRLATRAIELGKDDGNVLWMASWAVRQLANDGRRARELASRSLLINPNSAVALAISGWNEATVDNPIKALELFQRAERLSPRDPKGWFIAAGMAHAHYVAGQFDEAVTWAKKALAQNPRFATALRYLAASLAKLGKSEEAAEAMRDIRRHEPQLTLSLLRKRIMFMEESVWQKFAGGLRLAGLPE
jgi:TolB-like protein